MPTMLAALGLLLAGFFDLGQNAAAPAGEPAEHARAELLADVTAIEPGHTFRLGGRYAMDPEWHIYWKTAGDAGLATSVTLTLPEGFSAGELQWPVPERVATEGTLEIVTYTWHGEVILWTRVTAPENFGGRDSFTFGADSDWLVCKLECVPGEQKGMTLTS